MKFSVLISVYEKEEATFLDKALSSIEDQTLLANEIVLVKDGPLTYFLDKVIQHHLRTSVIPYVIVTLDENVGLGVALERGLQSCNYEWVARMDSDDIAKKDRFEKQLSCLEACPEIDVLGSWISEFDGILRDTDRKRVLPSVHPDLMRYAKYRNPINHMTVIFRKSAVRSAGGYLPMNSFEDYWLWIRMLQKGYVFGNIEEVLVYARSGEDMLERRRGFRYIKDEIFFQKQGWKWGFFSFYEMSRNIIIRASIRLLPYKIFKIMYSALRA